MTNLNPWKFGAVLSITVVVNYVLCALFWYSFPGPSVDLLNALFHGMDFRRILAPTAFSAGTAAYVLAVLAAWAYILGLVYAVTRNLLMARDGA